MQSYQSLPDLTGYKSKAAKRIARLAEEHTEKVRELGALGRDLEQARYGPTRSACTTNRRPPRPCNG
jgi:hypothetical protein